MNLYKYFVCLSCARMYSRVFEKRWSGWLVVRARRGTSSLDISTCMFLCKFDEDSFSSFSTYCTSSILYEEVSICPRLHLSTHGQSALPGFLSLHYFRPFVISFLPLTSIRCRPYVKIQQTFPSNTAPIFHKRLYRFLFCRQAGPTTNSNFARG